jgi:hypothetical protein
VDGESGTQGRQERCIQGFGGERERKKPFGRPSPEGRIILKWVFKRWGGEAWTELNWLRIRTGGGSL